MGPSLALYAMRTPLFNAPASIILAVFILFRAESAEADAASSDRKLRGDSRLATATPKETLAASWDSVQLVIYKSKRVLAVYREGNFEKEFPIVLGLNPQGRKRHAHDARTPEGLYRINGKNRHARWQYFLSLDYPNAEDRRIYDEEVGRGTIPDENGQPFSIGSELGIHGNDRKNEQSQGVDWTKGCVALQAADIEQLERVISVGTSVWIVK